MDEKEKRLLKDALSLLQDIYDRLEGEADHDGPDSNEAAKIQYDIEDLLRRRTAKEILGG